MASGGGIRSNGADPVIAFNVITGSTPTGLMLSYDDGGVVTNNVLDGNHDAGIYTFTVAGYGNPTTAILNNIVVDHAVGVHFTTDATLVQAFSNNDVWDNGTGYNLAMNPTVVWNGVDGIISADPLFTFSTPRDYYLQPLSPCVGAGLTGNNVTTWTSTWGYTVTED